MSYANQWTGFCMIETSIIKVIMVSSIYTKILKRHAMSDKVIRLCGFGQILPVTIGDSAT